VIGSTAIASGEMMECESCGGELDGAEFVDPRQQQLLCQKCEFARRQMERVQKYKSGRRHAS
jgi:hypothetical protein